MPCRNSNSFARWIRQSHSHENWNSGQAPFDDRLEPGLIQPRYRVESAAVAGLLCLAFQNRPSWSRLS